MAKEQLLQNNSKGSQLGILWKLKIFAVFNDLIKLSLKLNKHYPAQNTVDRDVIEKAKGGYH